MKISSIPQIYRHLGRWYEILAVLSKYELAAWIGRLGPDFTKDLLKARGGVAIARHPWETRLRMALAELGPTFIKLGQQLSTRPDLVGVRLAEELQQLQANVPADPPEVVRRLIEAESADPSPRYSPRSSRSRWPRPRSARSIGPGCSRARRWWSKCCTPTSRRRWRLNMDIVGGLAMMADMLPEFRNYRPTAIVAEFQRAMRRELDFGREERNIQQFAHDFRDDPTVHIPRTYPDLSSRRVLTMELLDGIKLSEAAELAAAGIDTDDVARRGAAICLKMIFDNGFYHADPHPGNLMVMKDGRIGLLDFGMVGRIDERLHEEVSEIPGCREPPRRGADHGHDHSRGKDAGRLGPLRADVGRGRFPLLLRQPVAGQVRLERGAQRDDGVHPPLSDHAAGADCHAAEGAGDAGRDRSAD